MSPEEFICVEPVGLIIGGIARNYSYLDEVEILGKFFCLSQNKWCEAHKKIFIIKK